MSKDYWAERQARAQSAMSKKTTKEIEKQLVKYYQSTMDRVIKDYERVFNQVFTNTIADKEITPAWLYQMDSYWEMQVQLKKELEKLGHKEVKLLSKQFLENYLGVYNLIEIPEGSSAFRSISNEMAVQMINQIWCADGKSWSARIWENTEELAETLNEELLHCVITGKKNSELKQLLQERFQVSYSNADMLVRTELAHIQTEAAKQRYRDYGIQKVEIWADEDERRCKVCGKLHKKQYFLGDHVPIPAHPRCRCCIVPVVD